METITLYDEAGTDYYGNEWAKYAVDYFAEGEDEPCSICGKIIGSGWVCVDGGDVVCDYHVVLAYLPGQ